MLAVKSDKQWCVVIFKVIHGLLDRTMQLLEVPYTEDKSSLRGYYLKAHEGTFMTCSAYKLGLNISFSLIIHCRLNFCKRY